MSRPVVRIVRDYSHAAELCAYRRRELWWLDETWCVSPRSIRDGIMRGWEVSEVSDPDGLLTPDHAEEVAACLLWFDVA